MDPTGGGGVVIVTHPGRGGGIKNKGAGSNVGGTGVFRLKLSPAFNVKVMNTQNIFVLLWRIQFAQQNGCSSITLHRFCRKRPHI